MKTGELVVCGLPLHIKDTPGQVFENICVRLNIGADAPNFGSPHTQFVKTANKSREENMLQISNLNPEVSTQLILNYRKLMKEKKWIKAKDISGSAEDKPIYINERLTQYFQLLAKKARDLKRKKVIKFVWTKGGRLFVRKTESSNVLRIKHENDLAIFK
ncbi:hypothetical protein DMENIID0001_141730 [Sergentomyia squamirostris]